MPNNFYKLLIFLLFNFIFLHAEQITDSFRLDGYANINMIETENKRADDFRLSGGLQGRYELTDNMSITGQVHFKEGIDSNNKPSNSLEEYDSDLKWLYLDYYLKNDITLRLGAFQFPIFKSAETGDIGYTYTWTHTPLSFYGVFGCDDFEGVEVLKNFSYKDFNFLAQISYGQSTSELSDGRGTTREGEADNLIGLTLKTTHDDFMLNIGYIQAKSNLNIPESIRPLVASDVKFNMFAIESEIYMNDYTFKSGLIKNHLTNVYPEDFKYYTSLEYNYKDFTPYILYATEIFKYKDPPAYVPPNLQDRLLEKKIIKKYSVGIRYDYSSNIAFKASYTHLIETNKRNKMEDINKSSDTFMGTINVIF